MQLQYTTSYFAATYGFMDISDSLASVDMAGTVRLIFSARSGNILASVPLGPSSGQPQGDITWARQISPDFALQQTATLPRLFNMSAFDTALAMNTIAASGSPNAAIINAANLRDVAAMQVLEFAGGDLAAISQRSGAGLALFQLSDLGALTPMVQILDGAKVYLNGVSDTAILQRGADHLLLAISSLENGISSYRISANGSVEWIDSLGAQNGLPVNGVSMLQTVTMGGIDFAIIAATNSDSLTVLRVNPMGVFFQTDHVIDDRNTRFDAIQAFDSFVAQGRFFVAAAGMDAGLSLFELLPNGRLFHLESFALEGGQGLQAVSAIKAEVVGSNVDILMVDARADRILHYDLSLVTLGGRIDAVGGIANGNGLDNLLLGSVGADMLNGGAGDDRLHDGAGSDVLTGGAGADVFVFTRDGALDRITDFTDGQDLIDLGDWGRIYTAQVLQIVATSTGAEIIYGDERLIVTSATGGSLNGLISDADFIF